MHLRHLLNGAALVYALNISSASASYFSSGWSPGVAAATSGAAAPSPALTGSQAEATSTTSSSGGGFDWTVIIKQGPIGDLFKLAGINVTERLEVAKKAAAADVPYDLRIPLITDENYESLVKEEGDPNRDDTWFMVVTMGNAKDPISKYVDEAFDKAYNISLAKKDLPHIKWGRVDYLAVTRITTEWMVWKAPVMVLSRDHGKELRFINPNQISLVPENIHKFLKAKGWDEIPVWDGPFAPGGDLEAPLKVYAKWSTKVYNIVSIVPKWLFLVASGGLASILIQFMHGKEKTEDNKEIKAGGATSTEKKERPKRFVVKKATEVHPDLSNSMTGSMTASVMSESDNPDGTKRPSSGPRRSTRKVKK